MSRIRVLRPSVITLSHIVLFRCTILRVLIVNKFFCIVIDIIFK
jgi:hypothetical protein